MDPQARSFFYSIFPFFLFLFFHAFSPLITATMPRGPWSTSLIPLLTHNCQQTTITTCQQTPPPPSIISSLNPSTTTTSSSPFLSCLHCQLFFITQPLLFFPPCHFFFLHRSSNLFRECSFNTKPDIVLMFAFRIEIKKIYALLIINLFEPLISNCLLLRSVIVILVCSGALLVIINVNKWKRCELKYSYWWWI